MLLLKAAAKTGRCSGQYSVGQYNLGGEEVPISENLERIS